MDDLAEKTLRMFKTYSELSHQDLVINAVGVALLHDKRLAALELISKISNGSDCSDCPHLPNRPAHEGCGQDVCLDQIEKIALAAVK